jgi:hypothetical protein
VVKTESQIVRQVAILNSACYCLSCAGNNFSGDIKIPRTIIINQVSVPNLQIRTRSGIAIEFPISALKPVMNILNGVEQW